MQKLDSAGNNFERGQVDTFQIECPNLGICGLAFFV